MEVSPNCFHFCLSGALFCHSFHAFFCNIVGPSRLGSTHASLACTRSPTMVTMLCHLHIAVLAKTSSTFAWFLIQTFVFLPRSDLPNVDLAIALWVTADFRFDPAVDDHVSVAFIINGKRHSLYTLILRYWSRSDLKMCCSPPYAAQPNLTLRTTFFA